MRSCKTVFRYKFFICFLGLFSFMGAQVACKDKKTEAEEGFIRFVRAYEAFMMPLEASIARTQWDYFQTSDTACRFRFDSLARAKAYFLHDKEAFAYLENLRESGFVSDPYLEKQLEILYENYLPCQGDWALQESILSLESFLRFRLWQRTNDPGIKEAEEVLRHSEDDEDLYRAWRKIKDPGVGIRDSLYRLVCLRNALAREAGFSDFYEMKIRLDGLNVSYVDSLFGRLKSETDSAYARMKAELDSLFSQSFSVELSRLGPWHFRGHFFQNGLLACDAGRDRYYNYVGMSHMVLRFFASIGLPMDDVMARSMMSVKDGSMPVFTCLAFDRKGDVRIIGNLQGTENDMRQLLARTGEAAYLKYIPGTLPYLLRCPAVPFFEEGISAFFGRMAGYSNWILSMGVFSLGQAEELRGSYFGTLKKEELFGLRWGLFMYDFERSLYKGEPLLGKRWNELLEDYMLISSDSVHGGFTDWAAENYFSLYAGNFHNVVLGELMASQLLEYFCTNFPGVGSERNPDLVGTEEIGRHLQKYLFNPGASKPWNEILEDLSGHGLSPEAFLRQFSD